MDTIRDFTAPSRASADFQFGPQGGKEAADVDWEKVRNTPGFYPSLPQMPDFEVLWAALEPHNLIILAITP